MKKATPVQMWRYSVRWSLPHKPCPASVELAVMEVPAGSRCPSEVLAFWKPGTGYAVSLDFPQAGPVKRWSAERRANVRRQNLVRRIERHAPLFADELIEREIAKRPDYFKGERLADVFRKD